MSIQIKTTLGADGVIRPPDGVVLPLGEIEVTVRATPLIANEADEVRQTREMLPAFAADSERIGLQLPSDLAEQHDHYAHGKPRNE